MKRLCLFLIGVIFLNGICSAQISVKNLRVENRINPLGIDILNPRFSWQLVSGHRNILQTAYEIRVSDQPGKMNVWESGKQEGSQSLFVPYGGSVLKSASVYYWQVRVWDNQGNVSDWSEKSFWQMGLLKSSEWKAKWIESGLSSDSVNGPAVLFRKQFSTRKKIVSATVFITAHGLYEAYINDTRVGDAFLTPGWTSYKKRLQYQMYDVTKLVNKGLNAIAVEIGSGWYRTNLAWDNNKNIYGKKIGLLFQLEIKYSDGSFEILGSDGSWKTSDRGPVRSSEIYNGEIYDSRLEKPYWKVPGFDDSGWTNVTEKEYSLNNLIATYNEPVKKHEDFDAIRVFTTPKGEQVIDFGQNLVGWETFLLVNGKTGDTITMDHAEVLDKEGNFYTDNLRAAKSENKYILNGDEEEFLRPHFTFHGFRYIRLKGFHGEIHVGKWNRKTDIREGGESKKTIFIYYIFNALFRYGDDRAIFMFQSIVKPIAA